MKQELSDREAQELHRAFQRTSEQGWGIALGFLAALGIFMATIVLVARGGPNVGKHLSLLSVYLPGYSVTWPGAFVGAGYFFFLGYGAGRTIATIYNRIAPRQ